MSEYIWSCKIGGRLPDLSTDADWKMRLAIKKAFRDITGCEPEFCFSGWDAELTERERAVVRHRRELP